MARKGLIKIEKLNTRTMRYILTPQGLQEKSRLTYRYIRQSYRQILKINQVMDQLIAEQAEVLDGEAVILCGPADEIMEILTEYLKKKNISYMICPEAGSVNKLTVNNGRLILIWGDEEEEILEDSHQTVNIMNII